MTTDRSPIEETIARAVLRVSANDQTLGTAFVVSPGLVITCAHVVRDLKQVQLDGPSGAFEAQRLESDELINWDIALLKTTADAGHPLPCAAASLVGSGYRSLGYFATNRGFRSALSVAGSIGTMTSAQYDIGGRVLHLPRIWPLMGEAVDRGISGAPLVDATTGVALGVINTHLTSPLSVRGTAVPFAAIEAAAPELRSALRENNATVPRYGGHMNALGVRELAASQVNGAITLLIQRGIYLPDAYCERRALSAVPSAFVRQQRPVLPLIGTTGSGKSSWLAQLATQQIVPSVLMAGLRIETPHQGIASSIDAAIGDILMNGVRSTGRDITRALAEADQWLLILLDGLNECKLSREDLATQWIPETLAWFDQHPKVRLILSCRDEFWTTVVRSFPEEKRYARDAEDAGVVPIGRFAVDEFEEAIDRYGLAAGRLDAKGVLSQPLMLRLASETARRASPGTDTVRWTKVLEEYIEQRCLAIGDHVGLTGRIIKSNLVRLAERLFERAYRAVDFREFVEIMGDGTAGRVLDENVLFVDHDRVRFTFDEVAEYLFSLTIDSGSLTSEQLGSESELFRRYPPNVILLALLRADADLRRDLPLMLREAARVNDVGSRWLLSQFFVGCDTADRYVEALEEFVDRRTYGSTSTHVDFDSVGAVVGGRMSASTRLDLSRRLVQYENGYGWRWKDLERGDLTHFRYPLSVGPAIERAFVEDSNATLAELERWLADRSSLASEGSVASVAGLALAALRKRWPVDALDRLVRLGSDGSARLLSALAIDSAPAVAVALQAAVTAGSLPAIGTALDCAHTLSGRAPQALADLMRCVLRADASESQRLEAAGCLLLVDPSAPEAIAILEPAFRAGQVSLYSVQPLVQYQPLNALRLVAARVTNGPPLDGSDLTALAGSSDDADTVFEIVNILRLQLELHPLSAVEVSLALEIVIYKSTPETLRSHGVVDLAIVLIESPVEGARSPLIYAFSKAAESPEYFQTLRPMLDALLSRGATEGEEKGLLFVVGRNFRDQELSELLDELAQRVRPEAFDQGLIEATSGSEESPAVRQWLIRNGPRSIGPLADMIRQRFLQ